MYENNQKLYKVSASTGKTQVWFGMTVGSEVVTSYGQLDGKLQTDRYTAEAKNIGRSNETSPEEQAKVELQAMYKDKITNGHYFEFENDAHKAAEVCRIPRKVTNYKDRYNKMSEVLLTSVKKNGSRACVINGELFSKIGRKEDIKVEHLREAVESLHEKGLATFDSEVYAEGLSLQRIRSAWLKPVKTDKEVIKIAKDRAKKCGDVFSGKGGLKEAINYLGYNPNEDAPKLKFYIFDIPDDTGKPFSERNEEICKLLDKIFHDYLIEFSGCFRGLQAIETVSHENRMEFLEEVVAEGSEGLMHYEPKGVYEYGKRSTNTAKSKPRYDAEALVTGVEKCKNGEGKLLLTCSDSLDNVKFKAMMKGTHESRMYAVQEQFIGKWVTFKYEELSEAGTPTKPVVEETRLCDARGEPLE